MDTVLESLVAIVKFHQLPVESEQLTQQFSNPGKPISGTVLLAVKALTLHAKIIRPKFSAIDNRALPVTAKTQDGRCVILARIDEPASETETIRMCLIHDLRDSVPRKLTQEEFTAVWTGELVLITRWQGVIKSLQERFDITWFILSLIKYRRLFGEVLIASFFLQLFALSCWVLF